MNFAARKASTTLRSTFKFAGQLNDFKSANSKSLFLAPTGVTRNFSHFQPKSNVSSVNLLHARRESLQPLSTVSVIMTHRRYLSIQEITKNLSLYTEDKRKIIKDPKTLRLKQDADNKPLVIILSWLLGKQKHLSKYAKIYMNQGCDVLVVQITPWQLLWPVKGSQQVAFDVVQFLTNNEYYNQMILHGFSVGGYIWGECLAHMDKDRKRYQPVLDRIIAQVFDSAADITEIPVGVPKALFPRNPRLQSALKNYMMYHMKTFNEAATKHYIRSSQMFHTNFCLAPALFFLSKTDPVGAEASNRRVADSWISNGINVTWKCFDRSPHVGHFMKHKEEYLQSLFDHLRSVNMVKHPELLRAKL